MIENNATASLLLGRSKIRQRILALLIERPENRLHLRAIARASGSSSGTAARELDRLVSTGLVSRTTEGRQVYFQADQGSPLYDAIRTIVRRTAGAPEVIRRHLAGLAGAEQVFVYGSYARGEETATSDVDLMIVGAPDVDDLTDRVAAAEAEIGRPVNYTLLAWDEINRRRLNRDPFMASIDAHPTLPVIDRA